MEVERISEESIKPSSPTPSHLKTYKISLLEQFISPTTIPTTLFYTNPDPNLANNDVISKRSLLLKQSLSETLTHFYPLAGKIKDILSIDCNDEGVLYIYGRVNIPLNEYLNQPDLTSLHKLLPKEHESGSYVAMIQETTFTCGGITIGLFVSHMFMDGISLCSFLKHWAATASRFSEGVIRPNFDASSIFPQYDPFPIEANPNALLGPFVRVGKVATKRFMFDEFAIASLKTKAMSSSVENPTRVEVVSALLLKCIMSVSKARSGVNNPTLASHIVDIRRRAVPPFPECSIGNLALIATALAKPEETKLTSLVGLFREAFRKVNSELVKNLQGDDSFFKLYERVKEALCYTGDVAVSSGVDSVFYSSWCSFGLYDINFGWGKPMWAACVSSSGNNCETPFVNSVILMDVRTQKGIEAWVSLQEDELDMLEKDKEMLAYACVNLSPLG